MKTSRKNNVKPDRTLPETISETLKEQRALLQSSEERYRRVVEMTSEGIWMMDAGHQTSYVNQRIAAMLGCSREEMLKKPAERFVFPEDREAHRAEMALQLQGRESRYERRFRHKDGHAVWVLVSANPILDEQGVFRGSFAMIADISELKQVEEELRRSEEQFRKVFEVASVGIVQVNPREGRILNCNETYCRITGYSFEELLKISFPDLTHPDDRESDWLIFSRAARGETPSYLNEKRYIRKDGSVIWVRLNAAFIRDGQGRPLKTVAICEDITEIRRFSIELEKERDKLRSYLETAQAIIVALDENGAITMMNRYGLRLLGYSSEREIIDKNWFNIALPQPLGYEKVLPVFQMIMRGELAQAEYYENEVIAAGGRLRLISWRNTNLLDEHGNIKGTLSTGIDVTEQRQNEEQLRQLQKTESLSRMAAAVAHKFNNHLAVVLGNLEMLSEDLTPGSDKYSRVEEAMQASRQAAEISTMMMAYLGQKISQRETVDLSEHCRDQLAALENDLPADISLKSDFSPQALPVRVDAGQLRQAIFHLFTNAKEAISSEKGIIRIMSRKTLAAEIPECLRFPLDWQPECDVYACLAIEDNGCGIPRENLDNLFDPFFSSKFTGRGLGLPLLLGFVKSHGGVVTVRSEAGRGSLFSTFLPLYPECK